MLTGIDLSIEGRVAKLTLNDHWGGEIYWSGPKTHFQFLVSITDPAVSQAEIQVPGRWVQSDDRFAPLYETPGPGRY